MFYIRKKKPSQTIINKVNEIKRTEQWRCIQNGDTQAVRQEFDLLPKEEIRQSLLEEQRYLCAYGEIYTDPEDKRLETDINQVLNLNGLRDQNGELIADTSTQLLKGRRDAYEQCRTFFRMLDQKNKFTSNMIKKRIDAIEKQDEMPEYAGVSLFFLKKKYRELRNRGL